MGDRDATTLAGGVPGLFEQMARTIADLQRDVANLQRITGSPAADFLWLPGHMAGGVEGELWVKRISTASTQRVAGPL